MSTDKRDYALLGLISAYFIGEDEAGVYPYLKSAQILNFFNTKFAYSDSRRKCLRSTRRTYCTNKLVDLFERGLIGSFFDEVLSEDYFVDTEHVSGSEAQVSLRLAHLHFSDLLDRYGYVLYTKHNHYQVISKQDNVVRLYEGLYCTVDKIVSSEVALKSLKDEYKTNSQIVLLFESQYKQLKALDTLDSVVDVYDYNEDDIAYTMMLADCNLEYYLQHTSVVDKDNIIDQLLNAVIAFNSQGIYHKHLNPSNILMIDNKLVVSNFNALVDNDIELTYVDYLSSSVKASEYVNDCVCDIYSVGKLINYILTCNSESLDHIYSYETQKAICEDGTSGYDTVLELKEDIDKVRDLLSDETYELRLKSKFEDRNYDFEVKRYLHLLDSLDLCKKLISDDVFRSAVVEFSKSDVHLAYKVIEAIDKKGVEAASYWIEYNKYIDILYVFALDTNTEDLQLKACKMLSYAAYVLNQMRAKDKVQDVLASVNSIKVQEALNTFKN